MKGVINNQIDLLRAPEGPQVPVKSPKRRRRGSSSRGGSI